MKITFRNLLPAIFFIAGLYNIALGQSEFEKWLHGGPDTESPNGIRSEEWYKNAPQSKPKTVIVAVLDSGVDIDHPDLKSNIWTNPKEIPGNMLDDDGNGYKDDVHGWNFLGGPNGTSVNKENLEVTRLYGEQKSKWENVDTLKLKGKQKKEYAEFKKMEDVVETKLANAHDQMAQLEALKAKIMSSLEAAKAELKGDTLNLDKLEQSSNEEVQMAATVIRNVEQQGVHVESIDWLMEQANEQFNAEMVDLETDINYTYNVDLDSRKIIGDTYMDFSNHGYGNNNVKGDFSYHGTHVSGIIGAVRDNTLGIDGVADHVAIMPVKIVPDGDERDKDVANGIYYAVNNGAQVINMSFGKAYSPQKKWVDEAIKYAAKHDVLIVHGSGNESTDMDHSPNFPSDTYLKKGHADNVLTVGATSPEGGESAIAEFSNYGKKEVDVFAPGVYIYSTIPDSLYDYASGTSMSCPVVSGVAALIRSRYPDLSAAQVKDIIMKSTRAIPGKVTEPGTFDSVAATELCVTGGSVDVVNAMKMASTTKGKGKSKARLKTMEYMPPVSKA